MITLWEGISGAGKTTLMKEIVVKYPKQVAYYKSFVVDSQYQSMVDTDLLMGLSFQDIILADMLKTIRTKTDILCFDRSLISGLVYHLFWVSKGFIGDLTWRPEYPEFYFDCLHNGINGPLKIFYIKTDLDICEQRTLKKNKKFYDKKCNIIFPRILNKWNIEIFYPMGIEVITLENNDQKDKKKNINIIIDELGV